MLAWIKIHLPRPFQSVIAANPLRVEQPWVIRYGVAVLSVLVAMLLMLWLNPWVPMTASPFLLFFGAVMVSAWYGGVGPGIVATLLSALAADYLFMPPPGIWGDKSLADMIRVLLFIGLSLVIIFLSASRRSLINTLKQEHALTSAIVDTAGSLIVVLDPRGTIVEFNHACEQMTGYALEEVKGKKIWDLLLPPDELSTVQALFQELTTGTYPHRYEGIWLTSTGDRRFITWSNTVLLNDRGKVRFVVGTGIDITARKQIEEQLEETNQTLQALVQAAPLAITVLDRQGRVKLWNPAASQIFGWREAEVLGQTLPTVPEHKWTEFQANLEATLAGDLVNGMETRRQHKNGSLVDIGLWTAVLRGSSVQEDSVVSMMADLSDRKWAEAALQDSQQRLMSLFEANVIGILFGDVDGGIEQANDEFLDIIGYSREELSNGTLDWVLITPAEYLPLDAERIAEARTRGACTPYEKEYIHKNGNRVPVLVGYTLLGEERFRSVAFVIDLTERKQLEQALRRQTEELTEANRMKDEFLAVLSHELRTPLNSMLGWSRLLRTRQLDADTTSRALETIERNARLQSQLIEDILDVSKIIRGKLQLHLYPIDLVPVIEAAVDAMRPAAAAKAISVKCTYAPNLGTVSGNSERLQQVFWNLLSNAVKFTSEGGCVEIRLSSVVGHSSSVIGQPSSAVSHLSSVIGHSSLAEHQGAITNDQQSRTNDQGPRTSDQASRTSDQAPITSDQTPITNDQVPITNYAQITVTDTGKGISPEFLPFVFDRFRQADSSTTRNDGGLGLGLAIVRHLIELHGGRVWAESPGLGQGATFTVQLPLLSSHPSVANQNGIESGNEANNTLTMETD